MSYLILTIFVALMAYWVYVHIHFWLTFKNEAPEHYKKYSGYSFLTTNGFPWIEYALRRGYKEINNNKINEVGEALCKAYLGFTSIFGILVSLMGLGFVLGVVWHLVK